MPTPTTTVNPDDIENAALALHDIFDDANNGYATFTDVVGRPTLETVDQLAIRLSRIDTDGPPCNREARAVFEVSIVVCIDDDPKSGTTRADASGRVIAKTMWRMWAGAIHVANQYAKTVANTDPTAAVAPRCSDIGFGDFTITYEANRALGRGLVEFGVPVRTVSIT